MRFFGVLITLPYIYKKIKFAGPPKWGPRGAPTWATLRAGLDPRASSDPRTTPIPNRSTSGDSCNNHLNGPDPRASSDPRTTPIPNRSTSGDSCNNHLNVLYHIDQRL